MELPARVRLLFSTARPVSMERVSPPAPPVIVVAPVPMVMLMPLSAVLSPVVTERLPLVPVATRSPLRLVTRKSLLALLPLRLRLVLLARPLASTARS